MNKPNPISILSLAIITSLYGQQANAKENQDAAQEFEKVNIETIAVTGSRIKRQNTSANPVQNLSHKDLNQNGAVSLGDALQELPSVGSSLNGNGSAGTSHGTSSLNLRNLGANRSLVLVNGHRWINGAGSRGFRDFVDMNTIPQAIVNRVEVLQDGATAIYGADAIAGVVNVYTHQDFVGTQVKAYYGESSRGDRETANIDLLWGNDFGESNIMFAVSYSDQKPVYTQDRDITAVPLNGLTSATPEGLFKESSLEGLLGFDIPAGGITRDPGVDGSQVGNWRGVTNDDKYNRYYNNYVVGPSEKLALYAQGTVPFDFATLKFEALYNKRYSDQQFSEVLSPVRGSRGFMISDDPRVNPFGVEFSGSDFTHSSFMRENGYRVNAQEVDTLRFGAGLEGEFSDDWAWDGFISWAQNSGTFTSNNQLHLDKLALGLRACDTTGIEGDISYVSVGCVPVNLFDPLSAEMVNYINYTGYDENRASQFDVTFNITGSLMELPAGYLDMAAGVEYRHEQGEDIPDSTISSNPRINSYRTTTSAPRVGTKGEYSLAEAYVEIVAPLITDATLVKSLELNLASRFSNYSTFGNTTNSKVGLLYQPINDLSLRGTWAQGFRAPSILELYEGERQTVTAVEDPCSEDKALAGCSQVPPSYQQADSNVQVTTGGNGNLQPETSVNLSYGLIYSPENLAGLSLTLDWYKIELENTISEFGSQNILDLCAYQNKNCDLISRDSTGEITNLIDGPINLNGTNTSGIDFVAYYDLDTTIGDFSFMFNTSKLNEFEEVYTLTDGSLEIIDKVGNAYSRESYPEWRGMFKTDWSMNQWFANYNFRYIGETTERVATESYDIESITYHNISSGYNFDNGLSLKLGINNLLDSQPPVSLSNKNINFDQNTYNPVGRFFYFQISYQL